jgi:flagellar hook assembly protein FlgD
VGKRATLEAALPGMESVGVDEREPGKTLPNTFMLRQNYPNPFNATTTLSFYLQHPENVTLAIYNALGQIMCTPVHNRYYSSGNHMVHWDGLDQRGAPVSSGIFFVELTVKQQLQKIKIVLVR